MPLADNFLLMDTLGELRRPSRVSKKTPRVKKKRIFRNICQNKTIDGLNARLLVFSSLSYLHTRRKKLRRNKCLNFALTSRDRCNVAGRFERPRSSHARHPHSARWNSTEVKSNEARSSNGLKSSLRKMLKPLREVCLPARASISFSLPSFFLPLSRNPFISFLSREQPRNKWAWALSRAHYVLVTVNYVRKYRVTLSPIVNGRVYLAGEFLLGRRGSCTVIRTACSYRGPAARAADNREPGPILFLSESFLTLI